MSLQIRIESKRKVGNWGASTRVARNNLGEASAAIDYTKIRERVTEDRLEQARSSMSHLFHGSFRVYVEQIAMFLSGVKVVATRRIEYLYSGGEGQRKKRRIID